MIDTSVGISPKELGGGQGIRRRSV